MSWNAGAGRSKPQAVPKDLPLPSLEDLKAELAKRSLAQFVRQAWPVLEHSRDFFWRWYLDATCEHLEAVSCGDIQWLIINMPPRSGKSNLVSILWPTWEWLRDPSIRWIFSSYDRDLSTRLSIRRRDMIRSPWYARRWGGRFRLSSDQNVKTWFENDRGGVMYSTSTGGSPTGHGAARIVIDDPQDPAGAKSDTERLATIDHWRGTLSTRFDSRRQCACVVIMQRLHHEDLTGWLEREEPGRWTKLVLPMEGEAATRIYFPLSGKTYSMRPGELLMPERFPAAAVKDLKLTLGDLAPGQLQQRPTPQEGAIFKRAWFSERYAAAPAEFRAIIQSWDTAFKKGAENARSAGLTIGVTRNAYYLLDAWADRVEFPELERVVLDRWQKWRARAVLIEDKASGVSLLQSLQRGSRMPVLPIKVDADKLARAYSITPACEAGKLRLPAAAPWLSDFLDELCDFPKGAGNDFVDALSQALRWLEDTMPGRWEMARVETISEAERAAY
jgi:predicted phage terminase large subunit-like protein